MARPDLYVVARFLERLWRQRRPHGKTELQLAVGLNYDVFRRYLAWMEGRGFVELVADGGSARIRITGKGVQAYETLVRWIRESVGPEHL